MKAIIIDDEKRARNLLRVVIEENSPEITELFEAKNLLEGIKIIKEEQPNIVFLDIEMPQHSGLEIFNFIDKDKVTFEIIFTTAYSQYAIQAFKLSAIDYLLKPIRPTQVIEAVEKASKFLRKSQMGERLDELKRSFTQNRFKKIGLPVSDGIKFVSFESLVMLQADGMYTKVSTNNEGDFLITKPLKHFADLLENLAVFYRPHRSFLINLKHIKKFVKKDGGYIVMDNDVTVSLSRNNKEEFLQLVGGV